MPQRTYPIIAREGWPIVFAFLIVGSIISAGAIWLLGHAGWLVAVVSAALCAWCVWFFRDPERVVPKEKGLIVSPADGVVCFVGKGRPPRELGLDLNDSGGMLKISVFMNVFNVHVNRSPCAGIVRKIAYHRGKFLNASFDKASDVNERCSVVLDTREEFGTIVFVQIAGLVARRIICRAKEGDSLDRAERYGLIRFGSRVDVYLPPDVPPSVSVGQRTIAGETVLARVSTPSTSEKNVLELAGASG